METLTFSGSNCTVMARSRIYSASHRSVNQSEQYFASKAKPPIVLLLLFWPILVAA